MSTRIFISHRTEDERIASVFNHNFQRWNVPANEIYQSSDARSGPTIGEQLLPQLYQALEEAVLCLWIYTTSERQEFCAHECTRAMGTRLGEANTRIAVFQVADEEVRLFPGQVFFRNTEKDLRRFVHQFHKEAGFYFQDKAFLPTASGDLVDDRARVLQKDLLDVQWPGRHQDRWRWDRFTLRLTGEEILKLEAVHDDNGRRELLKRSAIVADHFGRALEHFGYTTDASNITFKNLVDRWDTVVKSEPYTRTGWVDFICDEMYRAIHDIPAQPRWELMKSPLYSSYWFFPILNHARKMSDGGFEFDIYMYRFPGALPYVAQGLE